MVSRLDARCLTNPEPKGLPVYGMNKLVKTCAGHKHVPGLGDVSFDTSDLPEPMANHADAAHKARLLSKNRMFEGWIGMTFARWTA